MIKILILGVGLVGHEIALVLRERGFHSIGTTTTAAKVAALESICDEVVLLRSSEKEKLAEVAANCEAILNTVGPNLQRASNPDTREAEYHETLSLTAQNAAAAHTRCIMGSSLSVYGTGGEAEAIDEDTPRSASDDASPRNYRQAEDHILALNYGTVLRLPDIYGGENDLSYPDRVKLAHSMMGGTVPFAASALLYRLHVRDAARAFVHCLEEDLVGAYNIVDDREIPPTNQVIFDRLAKAQDLAPLKYTGNIALPDRPIQAQKIRDTGYEVRFTDYDFS